MPPETESPTTTPPQIQAIRSVAWARQAPEFQTIGGPWQPESEGSKLGALAAVAPAELANWIDRFHRAGIIADRNNSPDLFGQLTQAVS